MPRSATTSGATGATLWNCIAMVVRARKMIAMTNQRWRNTEPVMWRASARQDRHGRDFDERPLAQEPLDDHARGRRERPLEELPADVGRLPVVLGGRDVLGRLHHVLEAGPHGFQEPLELLEDVAGLAHDVAWADDLTALVRRRRARDEQEVPGAHRRGKRVPVGPRP